MSTLEQIPIQKTAKEAKTVPTAVVNGAPGTGRLVALYADASARLEQARKDQDAVKAQLQEAGLDYVFAHNVEHAPKDLISSVKLTDPGQPGQPADCVMFTWTKTPLKNDPAMAKAVFGRLRRQKREPVTWQEYLEWKVSLDFDAAACQTNGRFDARKYLKFRRAVARVAKELKVADPLSSSKVLAPKKGFHDVRFADFSAETNKQIAAVLPTTLKLEVVRPKKDSD